MFWQSARGKRSEVEWRVVVGGWCCCCCCRLVCEATQDRVPVAGQNAKERVVFGSINKVRAASLDSYRHEGQRHYLSPVPTRHSEHSISSVPPTS